MTRNQQRCLAFIRAYIAEHEVAPSYPEISAGLGTKSRSEAHALVSALVDQGELIRTAAKARNLRLPEIDLTHVPTAALRAELKSREQ